MAFPQSGFIKIYPADVTIVSGRWSTANEAGPQPVKTAADLDAYYDARVANVGIAPCIIRETEIPPASGVYVPNVGDHELSFSPSTIGIEFYDGSYPSPVVATLDLLSKDFPVGMTINQLQVRWVGNTFFGPSRDRRIDSLIFKYFGSTVETWTPAQPSVGTSHATPSNAIVSSLFSWSPIQALKTFGLTIPVNNVVSADVSVPQSIASEFFLLGVYNTQQFSFTNDTPLAIPSEIADITDADSRFDLFDEFKIYWDTNEDLGEEDVDPLIPGLTGGVIIPTRYFFIRTAGRIKFQIPENLGIPYGGRRLILYGVTDGVVFTGEIQIAQFNVLLTDGSGVYHLSEGKRNDTYYDRSTTPPTEVDLKFPRPGFRTGFF